MSRPSRMGIRAAAFLLAATAPALRAQGSGPWRVEERDVVIRDVRLEAGGVLPEARLHVRTLGTLRRDANGRATNAVLLLHGTTGSGTQFLAPRFAGELFGPGMPLDTARHFLVLPDGLGHGGSSKPSDGLRARFPRYGYGDMVTLERRLLQEHLGVTHLRAIVGTSMGAMHAWVWATRHPDWMDGIVPLAAAPAAITGRNRMWRRLMLDAIRADPAWQGGDYARQPEAGLRGALGLLWFVGTAPLVQQGQGPTREAADSTITRWMRDALARYDANDVLYAVDASWDYDPAPLLDRVRAPVLAINSADDVVNPPELGIVPALLARVPAPTRFVLLPTSDRTRGHGSHTDAALWKEELRAFLATLPAR